jgi:hypothetical protein
MSDRDPNVDWEQPRLEQSRGGAPHYSGTPGRTDDVPLASSGRRNRGMIVPIAIVLLLFVVGLVVYALAR